MTDAKKNLAILVSGSGTNLQAIIDAIENGSLSDTEISVVISNKKNAYALERAKNAGIENIFINSKDFKSNVDYDMKLIEIIKKFNTDLIILAGYIKILSPEFVTAFPNKIINIHPALLPDFGGKGMYGEKVHEAVLQSRVKESGCTVHFVEPTVDTGPIIAQKKVPVMQGDTVDTLSKRILEQEHKLLVESIKKILFTNAIYNN